MMLNQAQNVSLKQTDSNFQDHWKYSLKIIRLLSYTHDKSTVPLIAYCTLKVPLSDAPSVAVTEG